MKVCEIAGGMSFAIVILVTDIAWLGGAGDARLLTEVLRAVETASVGRLDGKVERGVDERWEAALGATVPVVAWSLAAVVGPRRRRMLANGNRQQSAQDADHYAPPIHRSDDRIPSRSQRVSLLERRPTRRRNSERIHFRMMRLQVSENRVQIQQSTARPAANFSNNWQDGSLQ